MYETVKKATNATSWRILGVVVDVIKVPKKPTPQEQIIKSKKRLAIFNPKLVTGKSAYYNALRKMRVEETT